MGVISEQVATEIIKYPRVLRRVCRVSGIMLFPAPDCVHFPKAETERGSIHAAPTQLI